LKGEPIQNFGDYLSLLLLRDLFFPTEVQATSIRLIGSTLDDHVIPLDTKWRITKASPKTPVVFWGCGVREPGGLNDGYREVVKILGARGPLSVADLKLAPSTPLGDSALLLPYFYKPRDVPEFKGKTLCIPHFHDHRPDPELLALSGCERVLRPNIPNHPRYLYRTIDAIHSADFVLTASLHGAIVALVYGRPFAYWSNGFLDLPFKWEDFAASVSISGKFADNLPEARALYTREIAPLINIPSLIPLLSVAPFPIRPGPLQKVLCHELVRNSGGSESLPLEINTSIAALASENPVIEKLLMTSEEAAKRFKDNAGIPWRSRMSATRRTTFFLFHRMTKRFRLPRALRQIHKGARAKPLAVKS
jgi:hypothetical protein